MERESSVQLGASCGVPEEPTFGPLWFLLYVSICAAQLDLPCFMFVDYVNFVVASIRKGLARDKPHLAGLVGEICHRTRVMVTYKPVPQED